mgnify:FL=1
MFLCLLLCVCWRCESSLLQLGLPSSRDLANLNGFAVKEALVFSLSLLFSVRFSASLRFVRCCLWRPIFSMLDAVLLYYFRKTQFSNKNKPWLTVWYTEVNMYIIICLCLIAIRNVERLVWTNKMGAILYAVLVTMETAKMPNVYLAKINFRHPRHNPTKKLSVQKMHTHISRD